MISKTMLMLAEHCITVRHGSIVVSTAIILNFSFVYAACIRRIVQPLSCILLGVLWTLLFPDGLRGGGQLAASVARQEGLLQ